MQSLPCTRPLAPISRPTGSGHCRTSKSWMPNIRPFPRRKTGSTPATRKRRSNCVNSAPHNRTWMPSSARRSAAMADSDNLTRFMQARAYVRFKPDAEERSTYLYRAYTKWCEDNLESPVPQKKFSQFLLKNAGKYGLTFSKHIEGKFAFVKRSETMKSPVGTLSDRTFLRKQDGGALPRQVPRLPGRMRPPRLCCGIKHTKSENLPPHAPQIDGFHLLSLFSPGLYPPFPGGCGAGEKPGRAPRGRVHPSHAPHKINTERYFCVVGGA